MWWWWCKPNLVNSIDLGSSWSTTTTKLVCATVTQNTSPKENIGQKLFTKLGLYHTHPTLPHKLLGHFPTFLPLHEFPGSSPSPSLQFQANAQDTSTCTSISTITSLSLKHSGLLIHKTIHVPGAVSRTEGVLNLFYSFGFPIWVGLK